EVDFADPDAHVAVQAGKSVYITGAILRCIDGRSCFEAGPLESPYKGITTPSGAGGGSLLTNTTHSYRYYGRLINAGRAAVHVTPLGFGSQDAVDIAVTTGGADNEVDFTFPPSGPTITSAIQATTQAGPIGGFGGLYRREQNGTNYHRVYATGLRDTMAEATL